MKVTRKVNVVKMWDNRVSVLTLDEHGNEEWVSFFESADRSALEESKGTSITFELEQKKGKNGQIYANGKLSESQDIPSMKLNAAVSKNVDNYPWLPQKGLEIIKEEFDLASSEVAKGFASNQYQYERINNNLQELLNVMCELRFLMTEIRHAVVKPAKTEGKKNG